jgi:hypothetical protein
MTILITLINSSSAFIERFFSVCGVINTDRNQNMKHDLFEIYAFLTSNMHILHTIVGQNSKVIRIGRCSFEY